MKHIKTNQKFLVELTTDEVRIIRDFTQNCRPDESNELKQTYLQLFVGMSRLLGYDMKDDGSVIRGIINGQ